MSWDKESLMRNFMFCLGLCSGRVRLGWAIGKSIILYGSTHVTWVHPEIQRRESKIKRGSGTQLPTSLNRACMVLRTVSVWLGLTKGFTLHRASKLVVAFQHPLVGLDIWHLEGRVGIGWGFIFSVVGLAFSKLLEKLMSFSLWCHTPKILGHVGRLN